ncbi:hypothetical protein [Millisia brevis]|uniref:hypothetical protein n=1 Tax=Millisia brevis TaxID=264148 RepID=UPI0008372E25|nr:hypothetical protein [Millisia brevis]
MKPDPDEFCRICQSFNCLAVVRSHQPPSGIVDFVDRRILFILSGHCTWRTTARATASTATIGTPVFGLTVLFWNLAADAGPATVASLIVVTIGALLVKAIKVTRP